MHWARWGDPTEASALSAATLGLVGAAFGPAEPCGTTQLADVRVPVPRVQEPLLSELRDLLGDEHVLTDHAARVRHTRGKSTTDLLKMRAGDGCDAPDAVVAPADHDQVSAVLEWCSRQRVALVPFGGGTSVVDGLTARREDYAGVLALDLCRLNSLVHVDVVSGTATLEAGLLGPEAEALLSRHGLTLGHFPSRSSTPASAGSPPPAPAAKPQQATAGSTTSWSR